jgi:hypothetical protein
MAARKVLDFQAREGYRKLKADYLDVPLTYTDLLTVLGLNNSRSARTILRKIAELAEADGLIIPWATPHDRGEDGKGRRVLADDPANISAGALHSALLAEGLRKGRKKHYDALAARRGRLSEDMRRSLEMHEKLDEIVGAAAEIAAMADEAIVAARREARQALNGGRQK